ISDKRNIRQDKREEQTVQRRETPSWPCYRSLKTFAAAIGHGAPPPTLVSVLLSQFLRTAACDLSSQAPSPQLLRTPHSEFRAPSSSAHSSVTQPSEALFTFLMYL
ncbi:MAG TPA: hypothetical protein VHC19_26325, partial [Pirellulales bacterium]|nr:hypothetical protein [Pirellulales bacterium]